MNTRRTNPPQLPVNLSSKSRRTSRAEQLLGVDLGDTVRKRELQVLGDELLDVRAADVVGLLELHNTENLSHM